MQGYREGLQAEASFGLHEELSFGLPSGEHSRLSAVPEQLAASPGSSDSRNLGTPRALLRRILSRCVHRTPPAVVMVSLTRFACSCVVGCISITLVIEGKGDGNLPRQLIP